MAAKTHQDILLMRWALFSVTGIVLIVVLYSVGVTPSWAFALREAMTQAPFLLPPDAPALSPGAGFLLCILLTLAVACNLLLMRGLLRKSAVLAAFLLLLACFTPGSGPLGRFLQLRALPAFRRNCGPAGHPVAPPGGAGTGTISIS